MGGLLSKFASLRESILRRSGRAPVRRRPSWLDARSDTVRDGSVPAERQGSAEIEETEAALRLLARLRTSQPPAQRQRLALTKYLGTIRRPTRLGVILLAAVAVTA